MDSIYPANPFRRTEEQRERYEAEQADRQIAALERIADALERLVNGSWYADPHEYGLWLIRHYHDWLDAPLSRLFPGGLP
jgi:hypothetical protein